MFSEKFLEHMLDAEGDEYICLRELVDDRVLEMFAIQAANKSPDLNADDDTADRIIEMANYIYLSFPRIGEDEFIDPDLPQIDPQNADEVLREGWSNIENIIFEGVIEKSDEEFPVLVDMFQMEGITFAYEIGEKEESLSVVLDWLVENEKYEEAAKIRDSLKEMGSNKVKQ